MKREREEHVLFLPLQLTMTSSVTARRLYLVLLLLCIRKHDQRQCIWPRRERFKLILLNGIESIFSLNHNIIYVWVCLHVWEIYLLTLGFSSNSTCFCRSFRCIPIVVILNLIKYFFLSTYVSLRYILINSHTTIICTHIIAKVYCNLRMEWYMHPCMKWRTHTHNEHVRECMSDDVVTTYFNRHLWLCY